MPPAEFSRQEQPWYKIDYLSPDPHALPEAAGDIFTVHPARLESAITMTSLYVFRELFNELQKN